ncbi:MerR family transcriptional regulator [Kitasatospora kifunensis]|uniref:DNA-binding transcriptional MerR regulator n=1 Tax=Kitasatospora kifunensis TaxID=58351 RepID=A0A7W7R4B6_KITKI|nr:MerR family transcriptional regulator [Kitasatospora kifunensis]MBB4924953.1 DNA-binding transcriptional MerR regulator [Kitasatospora kifunensis]
MRVGELSRQTGVPVPTIKYYLREGLLPAGELTCPNQAQYGARHVRRLKLVRALLDVGGLSIAAARQVLAAIDVPEGSLGAALGIAQRAVTPERWTGDGWAGDNWTGDGWTGDNCAGDDWAGGNRAGRAATEAVADWVTERGWRVRPGSPGRTALVQVLRALRELGQEDLLDILDEYATAAEQLAAAELALFGLRPDLARPDLAGRLERAVLGTVLGETLLAGVRRLAQEDAAQRVFADSAGERPAESAR